MQDIVSTAPYSGIAKSFFVRILSGILSQLYQQSIISQDLVLNENDSAIDKLYNIIFFNCRVRDT